MINNNRIQYEQIAVLAVYIFNNQEMFGETDGECMAMCYGNLLEDCIVQMQKEERFKKFLINEDGIWGIFENKSPYVMDNVRASAERIRERMRFGTGKQGNKRMHNSDEKNGFTVGMGLAAGMGCRVILHGEEDSLEEVWFGNVFGRAKELAYMSVCEGHGQILTKTRF